MKSSTIAAICITSSATLLLAVGLNLMWFGLYEFIKERFDLSYFWASAMVGGVVWSLAMGRAIALIATKKGG